MTSKELSRGCVISGKYLPKENSVITCDMFIAVKPVGICLTQRREEHTIVVNVNTTAIAMAECGNVEVC